MTDREEREQVLETLTNMRDWMETIQQVNSSYSTSARINALNYAISSIKTDLKYDLLYEDNQIADADKMIAEDNSCEPNKSENPTSSTTKKDLVVDCISRADARSLICKIDLKHHLSGMSRKAFKDLYNGIDELSSVTPKGVTVTDFADKCRECGARYGRLLNQKWIPVSERLPEPNRLVLCYITTGTTETYFLAFWNDTLNAWEEGIGGYRLLENDFGYEVIAWMPLPKEYKAETESEE